MFKNVDEVNSFRNYEMVSSLSEMCPRNTEGGEIIERSKPLIEYVEMIWPEFDLSVPYRAIFINHLRLHRFLDIEEEMIS